MKPLRLKITTVYHVRLASSVMCVGFDFNAPTALRGASTHRETKAELLPGPGGKRLWNRLSCLEMSIHDRGPIVMVDRDRGVPHDIGGARPGQQQRSSAILQEDVTDDDALNTHIELGAVREVDTVALGGEFPVGTLDFIV